MRPSTICWLLLGLFCFSVHTGFAQQQGPHRVVLTSAERNVHQDAFTLTHRDVPDAGTQPWSIRKQTLHGGRQEGVDLITIDNGTLQIKIIPTRGMSVLEVRQGDLRLGWDSPVKEVVHPQFINLESRGGLGWLEGFNEWMVRCGLEFAGHPGTDEFVDNTGGEAEMDLTLHGKIGNIPASEVMVLVDRKPPHRIRVRGVVHERMFYGPKLKLVAEISTVPGSDTLRISDSVTNEGAADQEVQLIYHTNYGSTLLEEGATVTAATKRVAPMNAEAAKDIRDYRTYKAPTLGYLEQVYLIDPYADADGKTSVLLQNKAGDRGASITWSVEELPYLTVWKNTAAKADGYVTGLEPGTGFPFNRKVERAAGRVPKLKPGQTRSFTLEFGVHADGESVSAMAERIAGIVAGRKTTVQPNPPAVD